MDDEQSEADVEDVPEFDIEALDQQVYMVEVFDNGNHY
jgi:hypothetical protein